VNAMKLPASQPNGTLKPSRWRLRVGEDLRHALAGQWQMLLVPSAFTIVDAAVFRLLNRSSPSAGAQLWLAALLHCQFGLLWIWTCLGNSRRVVRWPVATCATVALAELGSWAYHDLDEMKAISLGFFCITAVGITGLLAGMRLGIAGSPSPPCRPDSRPTNRFQYSLRNLFEAMTACALLMLVMKLVLWSIRINSNVLREIVLRDSPLAILFSAMAALLTWGVLGARFRFTPFALLGAVVYASQFWPAHIPCAGAPASNLGVIMLTLAFELVCLSFYRFCGVRLNPRQ
jgi:hypothetical protein